MEAIKVLNNVIEYIEDNLEGKLEIEEISKVACFSKFHFQRMFYALTGFTINEYIRNRRLTLAAEELMAKDIKIIDVALKYGYESPEAFTKAFQRLHGATPSAIKKLNVKIKAFPKISFQISIKGECEMVYKIVEKEAFKVLGKCFETTTVDGACYREIPEFCDEIWENGVHDRINEAVGRVKGNMLHGIHYDFKEDGTRKYMMGWEVEEVSVPEDLTILQVPESTWAVFEGTGRMPDGIAIQKVWKRIYSEWFPSSGFEQVEGPCLEKYYWVDEEQGEYTCEVWIPVKGKIEDKK